MTTDKMIVGSILRDMRQSEMQESITAMKLAEHAVIGSILLVAHDSDCREYMRQVAAILSPKDFTDGHLPYPQNTRSRIYNAMLECRAKPDQVAVSQWLFEHGQLSKGDIAYMSHCIAITPTYLDLDHYAKAVAEYSRIRRIRYHASKGNTEAIRRLTKPKYTGGITV